MPASLLIESTPHKVECSDADEFVRARFHCLRRHEVTREEHGECEKHDPLGRGGRNHFRQDHEHVRAFGNHVVHCPRECGRLENHIAVTEENIIAPGL